eukprot:COSAG02_NODE_6018_length_3873_cov_4.248238_2_plen_135_part_00
MSAPGTPAQSEATLGYRLLIDYRRAREQRVREREREPAPRVRDARGMTTPGSRQSVASEWMIQAALVCLAAQKIFRECIVGGQTPGLPPYTQRLGMSSLLNFISWYLICWAKTLRWLQSRLLNYARGNFASRAL